MRRYQKTYHLLPLCLIIMVGCLDSFQPVVLDQDTGILVVDGYLNASAANATVRLTRSSSLSDPGPPLSESNAVVKIETEGGIAYSLNELDSGRYFLETIPVDYEARHRLHVVTTTGQEYFSDYFNITRTTMIDSITWAPEYDGLSIMVSTHDPAAASKYYAWEYIEDWEYHSRQVSSFKFTSTNELPVPRPESEQIYRCYRSHTSTNLHTASSDALVGDVISEFPLIKIPKGSAKVSVRYSVLVRQRVVSKLEYEFLDELRKTTENLGTIFAPIPGKVLGNMRNNKNPGQPVLGYFSGGQITEKRFWIEYDQIPAELQVNQPLTGCELQYMCIAPLPPPPPYTCAINLSDASGSEYLIAPVGTPSPWGYSYTSAPCADCRLEGGVLQPPPFW